MQVIADQPVDLGANFVGRAGIAARPFLDHALDHRNREGDPSRLDRLQVDGGKEPRFCSIPRVGRGIGQEGLEAADHLAGCVPQCGGGVGRFAQVAHCRETAV